ncbi:enoyl-CoA hydratase/isomerase domain-containing protein [Tieghemostelium lacteum]|uniref:Enoyl-CoA hydratase/isomerase domain-containing protein n=1 Tax=Tieghemostelium lacteum TaxID=361077 RepID=A0A152A2U4_TIELA|nr:enoyl-CoA hydratase/isomerase domain-containing protein [Tieghemostelium lacteum]|eukprot:KYR00582.1 enoyl-CoA hydratase/isomerase domain-containing protein [Tieghemostelium lacteum]
MPENYVGLVPDNGCSYLLSPTKSVGLYMVLTGGRINYQDMIEMNLPSHFCQEKLLNALEQELITSFEIEKHEDVDLILRKYCIPKVLVSVSEGVTVKNRALIERCFNWNFKTFAEVHQQLTKESENDQLDEGSRKIVFNSLMAIELVCPLSLMTSFELIHRAEGKPLRECLINEVRSNVHMGIRRDIQEGIKRGLFDKYYQPQFDPPTYQNVTTKMVEFNLSPISQIISFENGDDTLITRALDSYGEEIYL